MSNEHWQYSDTWQFGSKVVQRGDELKIAGERGATFRFIQHVVNPPHGRFRKPREWIDVVGGPKGVEVTRSFRPERVTRVRTVERRTRRGASRT